MIFIFLNIFFSVKLPKAATSAPDSNLNLPDTAAFLALKTAENEESCPQDIDWKELISDILTEVMLKMANGQYPPIVSKETTNRNMNTLINEMTSYLMQCYARSHQEEKDQKVCLFLYIYSSEIKRFMLVLSVFS